MSSLTNKQIRELMSEFSPSPGFVLKLTRAKFEELVDDAIGIDVSKQLGSNGARLKHLFTTLPDSQVNDLVAALRAV